MRGTDEKKFSLGRVDSKTVRGEPCVNVIECSRESSQLLE